LLRSAPDLHNRMQVKVPDDEILARPFALNQARAAAAG
jgi:hypothetical protein